MRIAVAGGTGTVGTYVVESVSEAGHEPVILSRSQGVDVLSGDGLAEALQGVAAVVDTTNAPGMEYAEAGPFFSEVAHMLQKVGERAGVEHIVTLSIIGIENTSFGYYRAKLDQEEATRVGGVPHTVMRAAQLFEFPAQLLAMTSPGGDQIEVFGVRVQPVAARTVGAVLAEIAAGTARGRAPDLAGPDEWNLVDMTREFLASRDSDITVRPDTKTLSDLAGNGLIPGDGTRIEGPRYIDWLDSQDARGLGI